jgi:serine/threonine-protein kinase ULK/ATG1
MNDQEKDPKLKYKIKVKEPIGTGAFSIVYHGIDRENNEYAIKCISLKRIEKYNIEKFLLELKISTEMNHPNIVKSHEVFKTNKNWYIVTEYCNGGTLQDAIKKFNIISWSYSEREMLCKNYLTQLKNALKYLYKSNIIHRDLKPSNILISKTGENSCVLKLADFGFSRYFNSDNSTFQQEEDLMTSFCGTPLYMAPELLINRKYDTKADLWSFGVIMYEMLYGTNLFNYPKNMNNLIEVMQSKEISFSDVYTSNCLNLLRSLLQKDPKKRIEWKDFFKHQWFDRSIVPIGFSKDSLENLPNSGDDLSSKTRSSPTDLSPQFPLTDVDDMVDEYEVINIAELNPCDYQSCQEEENNKTGIMQILSNSVKYLFGRKS